MEIHETNESGKTIVLLDGRLDAVAAPDAEALLLALAARAETPVVLDLSRLEYVSSTGLQALIRFSKLMAGKGMPVWLCSPTPFVSEVFEISHLGRYFDIHPTREDALAAPAVQRSA